MRSILLAACVLTLIAPTASAQSVSNMIGHVERENVPSSGWQSGLEGGSGHWGRCSNRSSEHRQRAVRSCGRVIGERVSRTVTAYAHFHRAYHYDWLGDAERAQQDYARAVELLTQEVRANRNEAYAYFNRAAVLSHIDDYDDAIADYQRAAQLNQEWDEPYYEIGVIHFQRGEYSAALVAFDEAIRLDPDDAYNHAVRCEALAAIGAHFDAALSACEEALRLERDGSTLFSRGFLRFVQGDLEGAQTDFAEAVSSDPEDNFALLGRATVALRQGRQGEAEADMAKVRAELTADAIAYYANAGLRP